jgi:hypothetical protein
MTSLLEVKHRQGMMAKGSWMDITVFRMSFNPVKVWISVKPATNRVGAIATHLE